jgi:hypothetical protein
VRCAADNCLGEAVCAGRCFAHSTGPERSAYKERQSTKKNWVSLRGVTADAEVLQAAFGSTPLVGATFPYLVSLAGAEIIAPLRFETVEFISHVDLQGAEFTARITLQGCRFSAGLNASFAYFNAGPPSWLDCEFERELNLSYVHAERVSVGVERCTLKDGFTAEGISGALLARQCVFEKSLSVANASTTLVLLSGSSIAGAVDLSDSVLEGWHAQDTRFVTANQIGPLNAKHCCLERASFSSRVRIELASTELMLDGAQFTSGGSLQLTNGEVSLQQVSVGRQLRVAGEVAGESMPTVRSLRDADAGAMTFAHISMEHCLFYGAHDLGAMTLESSVAFSRPPTALHSRRRCIADEVVWRASRPGIGGWLWKKRLRKEQPADRPDRVPVIAPAKIPAPAQIAIVYRQLRRSLESRADQPGAADFYYGEMEMRRVDGGSPLTDRSVVSAYWLASGYGLLVSRSLAVLALVFAGAATVLQRLGFPDGPTSWPTALLFALRAVLPGMRRTSIPLTTTGEAAEIILGILGPILIALLLLALRGRVRR